MTVGPTVTRYELELGPGVKVARVTSLQRDIAYAMAAVDVRILAPIPGRSAIGVEVPNHTRQLVALGDLLASPEAVAATGPLEVAVGKDIAGKSVFLDLATTPHLLIAGATGAGKSSGINCIITSLLMRTTPDQVRLILIDPKQVEMGQYNRLPHLLTQPVTNPKKAANALGWAVKEMERRYDLLSEVGFRDIGGYNASFDRGELSPGGPGTAGDDGDDGDGAMVIAADSNYERLPYIVVVVDELNDLMMVAARDVEESITRIAQKARAVGIHLIVATQRPSVNVITGVIKANIPARMAFAVSSLTDSRVILDQPGAEKLVGKGDMLLLPGNSSVAQRIQGSFVGEDEVRKVVAHWRRQAPEVTYVSGVDADGGGGPRRRGQRHIERQRVLVGRRRRRRGDGASGDGARRAQPARLDIDAAAQAQGGLRPGRADHGPARAAGRGRPERGLQGAHRADDRRGAGAAAAVAVRVGPRRGDRRPRGDAPVAWCDVSQRFYVETLGCPKNQVDSDKLIGTLLADGMEATDDAGAADLVVVNTCAFIEIGPPGVDRHRPRPVRAAPATVPAWSSPGAWPSATATSWPPPCPRSTRSPGSACRCCPPGRPRLPRRPRPGVG